MGAIAKWTVAAAVLAAVVAAGSGSAAVPSTPSAVSTAFVQGYLTADPAVCDLATPRMQRLFARLAKGATCKAALAAARAEADAVAERTLVGRSGRPASHAGADRRAGEGEREAPCPARAADPGRRARGRHARARHRGAPRARAVVGTRHARGPRLRRHGADDRDEARALHGIDERHHLEPDQRSLPDRHPGARRAGHRRPSRPRRAGVRVPRTPTGSGGARVGVTTASVTQVGSVSFLLTLTPENRVDAVLIGSLLTPLLTGSGAGDTTAIGERLVGVWQRGDAKGLCAALHPGLRLSASIFGEKCEVASEPSTAERVTSAGLDGWSADGTSIVAVRIRQGNETFTLHHVVTPLASGYAVTGLFYDFDEIAALLLRPI